VRRTLALGGLVLVAAALALVVRPPPQPTGLERVRGHRVFGARAPAVRGIEVEVGARRFSARRAAAGWEVDGRPARRGSAEALDDLLDALVTLRAVDAFRPRDGSSYGLDRPRATVDLITGRGVRRVRVGGTNAAGSAFYARREGSPRIVLIGTLVLSGIERVFHHLRLEAGADAGQRPESG
jgi:hypothetical protein